MAFKLDVFGSYKTNFKFSSLVTQQLMYVRFYRYQKVCFVFSIVSTFAFNVEKNIKNTYIFFLLE